MESETPVELRIFLEGLTSGLLMGIGFAPQLSHQGSFSIFVSNAFCPIAEKVVAPLVCWQFLSLLTGILTLAALFDMVKAGRIGMGILSYGIAFAALLAVFVLV